MVNEIIQHKSQLPAETEALLTIYELLSRFNISAPSISSIYGQYCSSVDTKVMALQASLYPDDFYDGNPDRKVNMHLPDYIRDNISSYIGIPDSITYEEIEHVLDLLQICYENKTIFNSPLQGVW